MHDGFIMKHKDFKCIFLHLYKNYNIIMLKYIFKNLCPKYLTLTKYDAIISKQTNTYFNI